MDNFQNLGSLVLPNMLRDGRLHHGALHLVEDIVVVLPLLSSLDQFVELVLKTLPANLDRLDGKLRGKI